jgi:alpha-D-ribose 1-methylphosphonate 5-triphosphate synthase subunit PhnG
MTQEDIQKSYAEKCARLGDAVWQQRKLHTLAEHLIREIEALEQQARQIAQESATPAENTQPTAETVRE